MTWKCWVVIAAFVLLIAGGLWWQFRQTANFSQLDAIRVLEIEGHKKKALEASRKAEEALGRVGVLEVEKNAADGQLEALRAKWRARRPVKEVPLEDCQQQVAVAEQLVTDLEHRLTLEEMTAQILTSVVTDQGVQIQSYEKIHKIDSARLVSFKKQQRKDKVQKVFIGIGGGVTGIGIGLIAGLVTK